MPAAMLPMLFQFAMQIFNLVLQKRAATKAELEAFVRLAEWGRTQGLLAVTKRYKAEEQLTRTDDAWKEIELKNKH